MTTAHARHAFTPRQGNLSNGSYHAVLDQPLSSGRLNRGTGDALCKPRRKFWGLERGNPNAAVDCAVCIDMAERYGVTLTGGPR